MRTWNSKLFLCGPFKYSCYNEWKFEASAFHALISFIHFADLKVNVVNVNATLIDALSINIQKFKTLCLKRSLRVWSPAFKVFSVSTIVEHNLSIYSIHRRGKCRTVDQGNEWMDCRGGHSFHKTYLFTTTPLPLNSAPPPVWKI